MNEKFDYAACPYPEGMNGDRLMYFQHTDICRVVFEGYVDDDEIMMCDNILNAMEKTEIERADAIEGTQDIYYGSTGDIDSTAVNGIKDDLFQENEDAYYLTENAFAFAVSAMIPIGRASTAGNLTFKSTATIVAKEGSSMGAGPGAQKTTTDVTGNSKIKSKKLSTTDSINDIYGVLNSLIVRPRKEGYYETISGHRRKYAAERLGYKKIPVIIRMMQDDEAVVTMVDSNLQRE